MEGKLPSGIVEHRVGLVAVIQVWFWSHNMTPPGCETRLSVKTITALTAWK
jgi:hypothetical protein